MKKVLMVLLPISLFVFSCSTISHYPHPHINLDKSEVDVKNDVIEETNLTYIIGPFTFGEFDNVTEKVLFQNPEYHYLVHPIIETTTTNYLIFREVTEKVTTKVGKLKDRNTFYYLGVDIKTLSPKIGRWYKKGEQEPYSGQVFSLYDDGENKYVGTLKDGRQDGLQIEWYENGQMKSEGTFKDGKLISKKEWNEDGSPK